MSWRTLSYWSRMCILDLQYAVFKKVIEARASDVEVHLFSRFAQFIQWSDHWGARPTVIGQQHALIMQH